jgi:hypothetical protein
MKLKELRKISMSSAEYFVVNTLSLMQPFW